MEIELNCKRGDKTEILTAMQSRRMFEQVGGQAEPHGFQTSFFGQ